MLYELEKLLNNLYKDVPVDKQSLVQLCSFSFFNSLDDKKQVFDLLDGFVLEKGNSLIKNISIYNFGDKYRLKLLINTIE